jgi:hypothetical protein
MDFTRQVLLSRHGCFRTLPFQFIMRHSHIVRPLQFSYHAPHCSLWQRFLNWWAASRFVVGREKFLKCDFFNYIKIKNHKKWELFPFSPSYIGEVGFSAMVGMKTKFRNKLRLSNPLRLKVTRTDVDVKPSSTVTGNKRTNHTRLIMRNRSSFL